MSKRDALMALIGGIRCTRTLLPSEYTLVFITNPLLYHQPTCLRVEGVNVNHVTAIILAYYKAAEVKATRHDALPDEDEFTAGVIAALMEGVRHLSPDARLWLGTAPHVVYNQQSGVTIHSTYPDDDKLYPQTKLSLFEKGILITTQYINDLTLTVPTKD